MKDNTTNGNYPKTLVIRNEHDGVIWQLYHVQKLNEVENLATNATKNGFNGISLEDYQSEKEETFPNCC